MDITKDRMEDFIPEGSPAANARWGASSEGSSTASSGSNAGGSSSAGNAAEKVQDTADSMSRAAVGFASSAVQKADDYAHLAGRRLESMSASIQHLGPESGVLHSASTQIASTLKSSGKYLEEHGISGIAGELTAVIRKNPVPAIFAALGVGFLVARVTKRD